jgi:hypothetical protein
MSSNEPNPTGGAARRQSLLPESLCGCEVHAWLEEGHITLGRFRSKLEDAQASMHGPLLDYFSCSPNSPARRRGRL